MYVIDPSSQHCSHIVMFEAHTDALVFCSQFHINANYPRIWNMPQTWQCEVEVYKATYHFIFAQKNFFAGNFLISLVSKYLICGT